MARRSEHSQEEIKEMVLKAAEAIVIEDGVGALKVRRVAIEIGYTVGSIYMVFDNMADLMLHVKGRTLDDIAKHLKQNIKNDSAENTIVQLSKSYLVFATENYNRWNMIFEHRQTENELIPDWYREKVDIVFMLVELQFKRLALSDDNKQNKLAARALWSGVHGICTLSLSGKMGLLGMNNIENTVLLLVENFIKGWKTKS